MKKIILVLSLLFCTLGLLQTQVGAYEIDGVPVSKAQAEETSKYLEACEYQVLPDRTANGVISHFASDGTAKCAVGIGNTIFVYEKENCIAAYRFKPEGSYRLMVQGDFLFVYSVRDACFLKVDIRSSEVEMYTPDTLPQNGSKVFEMNIGDPDTDNGYYLTNVLGNRAVSAGYDRLIYVKNGTETVLYKTNQKTLLEASLLLAGVISLLIVFTKRRRKRHSRKPDTQTI